MAKFVHTPIALGSRFGQLTVVGQPQHKDGSGYVMYECLCTCGRRKLMRGSQLTAGKIRSCGCAIVRHYRRLLAAHYKSLTGIAAHEFVTVGEVQDFMSGFDDDIPLAINEIPEDDWRQFPR